MGGWFRRHLVFCSPTSFSKILCCVQAEQLMKQIGVQGLKLTEYEMNIASHLVDPRSMKVGHKQSLSTPSTGSEPSKPTRLKCLVRFHFKS